MPITIYNTLTREKEVFHPLEDGKVKMYVCGPTVYNYIHIGNARPAIVFDAVRRYLEYKGFDVTYVLNFTDVDDKIIATANEQNERVQTITNRFIDAYLEDVKRLGVKEADHHPRVTETMDDIIEFIKELEEKEYAYAVDGDVYFQPRKFKDYGKLSAQSIDELRSGARIKVGEKKKDPLDFALWKAAKDGEIYWDSPWGKGRPGWHIECSAMAKKLLGDTIDIHAGGQDLTFPHHENEIAQSEALNEKPFANYWMHNGYMNINNEKMSKSLGNFVLTRTLLEEYDPMVIRFFMLTVHYRNPINFSDELLQGAIQSFERIQIARKNIVHRLENSANLGDESATVLAEIEAYKEAFDKAMDDDFNTANAITVIFDLVKSMNTYLDNKQTNKVILEKYINTLDTLLDVLGIQVLEDEVLDEDIEALITAREEARKARDFETADRIRDELKALNIVLEDTAQGIRWRRN